MFKGRFKGWLKGGLKGRLKGGLRLRGAHFSTTTTISIPSRGA